MFEIEVKYIYDELLTFLHFYSHEIPLKRGLEDAPLRRTLRNVESGPNQYVTYTPEGCFCFRTQKVYDLSKRQTQVEGSANLLTLKRL